MAKKAAPKTNVRPQPKGPRPAVPASVGGKRK